MVSRELVRTRLQQYNTSDDDRYRGYPLGTAAVLVPLLYKDGDLHVLLNVRSTEVGSHQGEVCFPGGKSEAGDKDSIHTALREAEEEIGLRPEDVDILGKIVPFPAKSGLLVTPVIGFIPDGFQPKPNDEVADIFTMPLENFLHEDEHTSKDTEWKGVTTLLHFFNYKDNGKTYVVWGLTAHVALLVASLVYERSPEFGETLDVKAYIEGVAQYLEQKVYAVMNSSKL